MFGMSSSHRDLLLVNPAAHANPDDLKAEIDELHQMLNAIDNLYHCAAVCEIVDLNRYKKITQTPAVAAYLQPAVLKPFVFLLNRN